MKLARIGAIFLSAFLLQADVKTEEKSQVKFEGFLGRMTGMFGGKTAKEGLVNTVAVKGNRKTTVNEYTGEIIDLDEEKVYELDMRKKNYQVTTFAEMRRRMREAQEKAARTAPPGEPARREPGGKEMEIDFSLKESGQKKVINGFDCREVIMTITAREKGKTLEQGGGSVMTSNTWLAPKIGSMKEIAEFDRRYAQKLEGAFSVGGSAEQMAMALAMYPAMKDLMGKFQAENVNMDGTAVLTTMTMEMVRSPEQMSREKQQEGEAADVASVRGLGGLLGRKLGRKKAEAEAGPKNRSTFFTMTHELLKASGDVAASEVAIPAGFKERK